MKSIPFFTVIFALFTMGFYGCDSMGGPNFSLEGKIDNAQNLTVEFEHIIVGEDPVGLAKTTSDESGHFEFSFDKPLDAGIYRVKIGAQAGDLILNGDEEKVVISGDINDLSQNIFEVEGSQDTEELVSGFQKVVNREFTQLEQIAQFVENTENAYTGTHFAIRSLQTRPEFASVHESASKRLTSQYPGTKDAENYATFVSQIKDAQAQSTNRNQGGPIKVGMEAPEIEMEGPNGETHRLSDLRGSVVLLDFWAAWCRPCRIANPKVVQLYNKYKDQGFKVFNVSLDGLDSRTKARLPNQEAIDQQMAVQKQRWIDAIEQDGLDWPWHVSNLQKWECEVARTYGVRAIPRTYLIDRDGKIAAINPRAQADLESELQKLL